MSFHLNKFVLFCQDLRADSNRAKKFYSICSGQSKSATNGKVHPAVGLDTKANEPAFISALSKMDLELLCSLIHSNRKFNILTRLRAEVAGPNGKNLAKRLLIVGNGKFDIFDAFRYLLLRFERRSSDVIDRRCLETFLQIFPALFERLDLSDKNFVEKRVRDVNFFDELFRICSKNISTQVHLGEDRRSNINETLSRASEDGHLAG